MNDLGIFFHMAQKVSLISILPLFLLYAIKILLSDKNVNRYIDKWLIVI